MADHTSTASGGVSKVSRRNILFALPATALACAVPAVAAPADPLADLVVRYIAACKRFSAAAEKPGGGDFDSPECLHWSAEYQRLEREMVQAPIRSAAGVAALMAKIEHDSRSLYGETGEPVTAWWQIEKIKHWAMR